MPQPGTLNSTDAPPINNKLSDADQKRILKNVLIIRSIAGGIGTLSGLGYAFYKKKGFWGYVGFSLLGGIVFGTIGAIATAPMVANLEVNQ